MHAGGVVVVDTCADVTCFNGGSKEPVFEACGCLCAAGYAADDCSIGKSTGAIQ